VRIFLLAFAVIDDIAAILIIALFYSGGLDWPGLLIVVAGLLGILGLRTMNISSASVYVIPGAAIWYGLLQAGLHPTLAGVILGLMTPVHPRQSGEGPLESAAAALTDLRDRIRARRKDSGEMLKTANALMAAPRELIAPVVFLQSSLHPWVAYGIMPLFALANAGVSLDGLDLGNEAVPMVVVAVFVALVLGKPLGIVAGAWIALRAGLCHMPAGLNWPGIWLAAFLGGIGFTMSIFIATLAFHEYEILAAAKLGVLTGSLVAGLMGAIAGRVYLRLAAHAVKDGNAIQEAASR
jgi:NhaA family Na+:H+ antiporter